MKDETLLPCPFCGGEPEEEGGTFIEYRGHERQDYSITCKQCGAEVHCEVGDFEGADAVCSCHHNTRKICSAKWNRRALQSGNSAQPVTVPDEKLPLDYLQGQKDGLEWAAQMAEASHPQTGDWLYDDPLELAKAIRKGPDMPESPADGWIPVSERMPENNSYVSVVSRHGEYVSGLVNGEWLELHDGSSFPVSEIYLWLTLPCLPSKPLPDAPKGV